MLLCAKCKQTKDVDKCSRNFRTKSGRQYYCRACQNAYNTAHRAQKRADRASAATPTALDGAARRADGACGATEDDQLYLLRYPWEDSPIKVGHAKDVAARVHSLEAGHNMKLQVLAIFPGQGRLERRVHALLSDHRATDGRGQEWFNVNVQQALLAAASALTFARSG